MQLHTKTKQQQQQRKTPTCSFISCNCCCNFCISFVFPVVSLPPLFIMGPCGTQTPLLLDGLMSSSLSALTSEIVPRPPLHTVIETISSICCLHRTHFFIICEQLSQTHIWPHGLKSTEDFLSEHTTHSSI